MAYPYHSYQSPFQQGFYNPYQQQFQQLQQSSIQQPIQSGILWVSGAMEAQAYPIAPNNAVALWEKSGKTIYLKSADATGRPSIKVYDLVERTDAAADGALDGDGKAYATKDELGAVVGAVKGFDELIGGIKADIETLKSDMYGIAGKKTAKKPVKEEDDD